jgi:hypothetical protein
MNQKRLPLGIEDYKEMINFNYYYVDKTLLIKELLAARSKNNLFLRPRRFGKTLLLSTLKYFFEDTGSEEGNAERRALFDGMKIRGEAEEYQAVMTSFPVISLTLKSANQEDFAQSYYALKENIAREFMRHQEVLPLLNKKAAARYQRISDLEGSREEYNTSLQFLSESLFAAYGKNVIILIDEYDVPLETAYFSGFYDEMTGFIRSFFESALKTNPYLEFSVITGCLRISKESIFTGLNNLKIVSILNEQYGEYYGFTQNEVDAMLEHYSLTSRREDLRLWFDGYNFGQANIYNPWSVLCSLDALLANANFLLRPQWANTSSNEIVKTLVAVADREARAEIENLIAGGTVEKPLHEEVTYSEMKINGDNLWNFLFFTGYLTQEGLRLDDVDLYALLCIPNSEVRYIFRNVINNWFHDRMQGRDLSALHEAILTGNAKTAMNAISGILQETISFYDYAEKYYHGILIGLLAKMPKHLVRSNRQSGIGRPDIVLEPYDQQDSVIIIELKVAKKATDIASKATEALTQIASRNYEAEWRDEGYKKFLFYGIAFYKKTVCIITRNERTLGKLKKSKSAGNATDARNG